jgi:hypothetical protein
MKDTKIIKISKRTYDKVTAHAVYGDSMDEVIERIVDFVNLKKGFNDKLIKKSR